MATKGAAGRTGKGVTSKRSTMGRTPTQRAKVAARKTVRTAQSFTPKGSGTGLVYVVSQKGNDRKYRQRAVRQVRQELGKKAAVRTRKQLRTIDRVTSSNPQARTAVRKAANKTAKKLGSF